MLRARDHGPRDHGPRDHGPRDHGPRDHGPRATGPRGPRDRGTTGPRDRATPCGDLVVTGDGHMLAGLATTRAGCEHGPRAPYVRWRRKRPPVATLVGTLVGTTAVQWSTVPSYQPKPMNARITVSPVFENMPTCAAG